MKRLSIAVLAAVTSIASLPALSANTEHSHAVRASLEAGRQFVSNELLVQFKAGASSVEKARALGHIKAKHKETVAHGRGHQNAKGDLQLVQLPAGLDVAKAKQDVEADPAVEFAEPNWIYTHNAISNDTYYTGGQLWGMYGDLTIPGNTYGSHAGEQWLKGNTCSSNVYIGVIDEGIMHTHDDLAANVWTNPFDAADGIDNDGNGLIDDVHGWDFANKDNTTFDGTTDDHGTHVSGTIAGVGGNGKGVAGMCWNAKLISAKFLGRNGGTTVNAVKAVNYLTDLKQRHGLNIVATNNSWGGGGYSQALKDAIDASGQANILFIAAAGNETNNNDTNPSYPASYASANIIAVSAITSTGALASFSNYGANKVHIGAPGQGIYSTLPISSKGKIVAGYGSYNGTSMATPHVSGAVALYASSHPNATAQQIKDAILLSAIPTASLVDKVWTGGRLDVGGF